MLRKESWNGVDLDGWTFTGDEGNFLASKVGRIKIYKREYNPGRYKIDNKSALYLFNMLGTIINITFELFNIILCIMFLYFVYFTLQMMLFYGMIMRLRCDTRLDLIS